MVSVGLSIDGLRVEYQVNPIGIDVARPRLSWTVASDARNSVQSAYRVLVASTEDGLAKDNADFWDSGRVESSSTAHIAYGGPKLRSGQRAWWKVQVWDGKETPSDWSQVASWETGLLKATEWQAKWVSVRGLEPDSSIPEAAELDALLPVSLIRTTFQARGKVTRARLYSTARGVYVPYLNGERVGDQVLAPGWTDYNARIQYQAHDVTGAISEGENVLGAELGTGWFAGYVGWQSLSRHYGPTPQLLMQLHLEYEDGSSEVIGTNGDWKGSTGPTRYSDFIMGEYHDARLESDWSAGESDDGAWSHVQWSAVSAVPLVADCSPPVRALDEIPPVERTEPEPGTFIFDLGQNIAGWARLKVKGEAGTTVKLRFAEILNPDGSLYVTNLRSARATDTYILAGTGNVETFEPRFTWHGFRYVEVTGYPGNPEMDAITGRFVGSNTEVAGSFQCSDELVNKLQQNIVWGQRGNFLSVPTDCPQRDERLGWLGDAQVFIGTAVGNMDVAGFFTKWMRDVVDGQTPAGAFPDVAPRAVDLASGAPAWADAGVIVPWTVWKTYGDTRIIDEHWSAMERWMNWLLQDNPDYLWRYDRGNDFGDWLSIGADTPKELIGTAYWGYDARLLAEMAEVTGRAADAARYRELFDQIAAAFRNAYVREDSSIAGETQSVYCLALHFGLLEEGQRASATALLVADIEAKGGHLSTGFVGVSYLCHVLTANGRPDVAYRLLHQETFPSWKYSILHGATTIWERWDGWTEDKGFQDPGMNSFNHYSLGSVGEWMRRTVAGIDNAPGTAGHTWLRLAPVLDDSLTWAEGSYTSMSGVIRSRWDRRDDATEFRFTVPANVEAEIMLPANSGSVIREGGDELDRVEGLSVVERGDEAVRITVGSGTWHFTVAQAQ
jgi:alpha-L-rhamnosidase